VLGTKRLQAEFLKEPIDFIEWAEAYIQQLDPLTPSPHNSELTEGRSYYTPTDEKLEAMMLRITGAEWRSASKLLL
jgi:hypothetical protein